MKPNKLDLSSVDGTKLNLEALYQIAPSCFTEVKDDKTGELRHVVNFKTLRQLLGDNAVEDVDEMYQFTWPGKQEARREAARPTTKTLRPVVEDSVDWDNTQNLYIEGDNLEVLKLLQKSYMGKVKMIYIDPPYNTGNDFVYDDDFAVSQDDYDLFAGNVDELGNRYRKNTETNGRFHSDWCSMIYPRLMVARSLLSENGVIFISIDENEIQNMRKITDDIFGEANFVSQLGWQKVYSPKNQARYFSNDYEYVLCYAKCIDSFSINLLPRTKEMNARYKNPDNDPRGDWKPGDCVGSGVRKNGYYDVVSPKTGKIFNVPQGKHWVYAPDNMKKMIEDNRIWFGIDGNAFPSVKQFLSEVSGRRPSSLLMYEDYGHTDMAKKEVIKLFSDIEKTPFDTPKPTKLIKLLTIIGSSENDIILDFFSGSATTAHSILELNSEQENSKRKFILVQLPEQLLDNDEAVKKGLHNLCEVGKERIRRAGKKIKEESPLTTQNLDTGFRVFRLADSNFEEVKKAPAEYDQAQLDLFLNNVKSDRTDLDLLFGAMLSWGVQLSLPMTSEEVDGKMIYSVNDGDLVACFADDITENIVKAMADKQPLRVLFRDSCFALDDAKINVFETLKQLLDWSEEDAMNNIKVI
ncbi:site-specific DNA-methyltransferase [Bacteroides gallinaceum]|uniref:site-specific DNA-methyltransferase n=1 Tax=Bacteroides gallinaceum TaxID=1462571 RepID=UPI0025AB5941|nr:site-specific DNA-methyltransferase [Bacteroides gallinaceum]MDN0079032.1 site-specific DNA-methyltransferase [Bacteroides gallinaceum]